MQQFNRLVTILVFAAHALLGCGAHHACQDGQAASGQSTAHHASDHGCLADHQDDSHQPADEQQDPAQPCQHATCSFVKAETVRIHHGDGNAHWLAAVLPLADIQAAQMSHAACEPVFNANLSSAHLYVWHCALLI